MTSADVVVIGGGVNGASIAFNLARLGVRRVVLRAPAPRSGRLGQIGLPRAHALHQRGESRLAWESLKVFRDFDPWWAATAASRRRLRPDRGPRPRRGPARPMWPCSSAWASTPVSSRGKSSARDLARPARRRHRRRGLRARLGIRRSQRHDVRLRGGRAQAGATIETDCEALRIVTEGGRVAGVETSRAGGRCPWWWPSPARGPAGFSIRSGSTSGSRPTASRSRSSAGRRASRAVTRW